MFFKNEKRGGLSIEIGIQLKNKQS